MTPQSSSIDFVMPSLGADMEAGTLLEWHVQVGDRVRRGQLIALVSTQKATMEIECWHEGVVAELLVVPGTKVPVGTVLARLRADQGRAPMASSMGAGPSAPGTTAQTAPAAQAAPAAPMPRVLASPAARHLARQHQLELARITGSGRHGVILLRDVERARAAAAAPAPALAIAAAPPPEPVAAAPAPSRTRRPVPEIGSPIRQAIGAAMTRSKREIPHYYLAHTLSLARATEWLARQNAALPVGERLLPAALYIRAVALALWEVPELNGTWGEGFCPSEPVHVGFAVALRTGGVIAPAIHDADQKTVAEIMADLRELIRRSRAGALRSSELTDPTITITSVGERGPEAIWGVINPPQVAIVGVGAIVERPWVEAGAVVVHPTLTVTLAADHRVSDGHRGGLFLTALDRLLQEPAHL